MIDREFLEKIEEMTAPTQLEIGGITYSNKQLFPVFPPLAAPLAIHNLTGISDYLKENRDNLDLKNVIIHVEGPALVNVYSRLGGNAGNLSAKRDAYLNSSPILRKFPFGNWLPVDDFIVKLQTYFVPGETVSAILKIVGNITDSKTMNFNDDGVTQQVTAKSGIARVENVPVPNPVTLAPYRTFMEIRQPESRFVFRLQQRAEAPPMCALFEADGGAWEMQAIADIKSWLNEKAPIGMAIVA